MASKGVIVGLSVSGAAALIGLMIVLILVFKPKHADEEGPDKPEPVKCKAVPSVNGETGEVTNYDELPMPDNTCGENVDALNQLCLQTVSTATAEYSTWHKYIPELKRCVKVPNPTCEQQVCDATYCSPSVRQTLPPIHKKTAATGQCVNPTDLEIATMCNKKPGYQYVFPNCEAVGVKKNIDVTIDNASTSIITGQIRFPKTSPSNLVFSYKLTTATGSTSGSLLTEPPLNDSLCGDARCLSFTLYPPLTVTPGTVEVTIYAQPEWSNVHTMESSHVSSINLTEDMPSDPNTHRALNVSPTRDSAAAMLNDAVVLRSLLAKLASSQRENMTMPLSTFTVKDLFLLSASSGTNPALLAACAPPLCPFLGGESKLMPFALVFVAWPDVTPLKTCDGSVTYSVSKRLNSTNTVSNVTSTTTTGFVDLVRVGETVSYTIVSHQGVCVSQPVAFSIRIPAFTDSEVCHKVKGPSDTSLPPWTWATSAGCVWYPDYLPAQDFYCSLEYNKVSPSLDPQHLYLADYNNKCQPVLKSYPEATTFLSQYCDNEEQRQSVCFTGLEDNKDRTATCFTSLPLGDSGQSIGNVLDFSNRLGDLVSFFNLHSGESENTSVESIATSAKQEELYNTEYYHCGPATDPTKWGVLASSCQPDDTKCVQAAESAKCGTGPDDRNVCLPWKPSSTSGAKQFFSQSRVCYASPTWGAENCCEPPLVYSFDNTLPTGKGSARGTCALPDATK